MTPDPTNRIKNKILLFFNTFLYSRKRERKIKRHNLFINFIFVCLLYVHGFYFDFFFFLVNSTIIMKPLHESVLHYIMQMKRFDALRNKMVEILKLFIQAYLRKSVYSLNGII